MPLPPALAARLKKRGILTAAREAQDPQEEIIAADYSDQDALTNTSSKIAALTEEDEEEEEAEQILIAGETLPIGWFKVKDSESGYFYYWNSDDDKVSWLHPDDPNADITLAASMLKAQHKESLKSAPPPSKPPPPLIPPGTDMDIPLPLPTKQPSLPTKLPSPPLPTKLPSLPLPTKPLPSGADIPLPPSIPPPQIKPVKQTTPQPLSRTNIGPVLPSDLKPDRPAPYEKPTRENRDTRKQRRKPKESEELDPMDPASYSDTPRGTWSTGLPKKDEAKTGVDVTANGPLYQMRPYPAPGAVLRANAAQKSIGPTVGAAPPPTET